MNNREIITANISSSFISRTKCKECLGSPIIYFFSRKSILWYDPNKTKNMLAFVKKHTKRMSSDYSDVDMRSFRSGLSNHSVNYKGYRPKLHHSRGVDPVFDLIEYLTCECGGTVWAFSDLSARYKVEVNNRKGKYFAPSIHL